MGEFNAKLLAIHAERRQPLEVEAYEFLTSEGINFPPYHYARTEEEMEDIMKILDTDIYPSYAFKVMSPKILHKSDFKAVFLNVTDAEAIATFRELKEKFTPLDFRGVLIVPMATEGIELLLGSTTDATFGLITVFGIGGTLVEILKDVTFGKSPLSRSDAQLMIKSIKSQEMLEGPRGLPKLNEMQMVDLMVKISDIACRYQSIIKEIDLNPLRITDKGIFPLDARIILHSDTC